MMGRSIRRVLLGVVLTLAGCVAPAEPGLALPGAEPHPRKLQKKLNRALGDQEADYVPRTRHLEEDGSPKYTNRLMLESSPYLRQHAHNPVNWYPWGDEAFEAARKLNRPVLLSIGYSTCHWCHVMEEESFENERIAAFLNANYIVVKVDREERPDVDAIYMAAVYAFTGRGGWPMTTWLTPDREPFHGGTYYPPRRFLPLLMQMKKLYEESPDKVASEIAGAIERVERGMTSVPGVQVPSRRALDAGAGATAGRYDEENGGSRGRPKFPSNFSTRLLYRQWRRTGDERFHEMATVTLDKMARGGIHDQLGGGFHRYSTDRAWLVPHFEKMLYDNAQLTMAYLEGYQVTGNDDFAAVARKTLHYVAREMTSPEGPFYSATDADSLRPDGEMEEGWFFLWTPAQLRAVIGAEEARLFESYYGVTEQGNFESSNILNMPQPAAAVAGRLGMPLDELERRLDASREKLYEVRLTRPAPLRDEKFLTAWNGLMISAMARGGFVLKEPEFVERAAAAASFLLENSRVKGRLFRSYKDGRARHLAYLDDYAFLIAGLLDLFEATSEPRWLKEALSLQRTLDEYHLNKEQGGYFLTSHDHETLLARQWTGRDRAVPSGNSIAAMNLLRLHELTLDERYLEVADGVLIAFARTMRSSAEMMLALDFRLNRAREVVIVTRGGREQAEPLLAVLREKFVPAKVVTLAEEGPELEALAKVVPLVRSKVARRGKPTAYVCEQGLCQLPTSDPEVFARQLAVPHKPLQNN